MAFMRPGIRSLQLHQRKSRGQPHMSLTRQRLVGFFGEGWLFCVGYFVDSVGFDGLLCLETGKRSIFSEVGGKSLFGKAWQASRLSSIPSFQAKGGARRLNKRESRLILYNFGYKIIGQEKFKRIYSSKRQYCNNARKLLYNTSYAVISSNPK